MNEDALLDWMMSLGFEWRPLDNDRGVVIGSPLTRAAVLPRKKDDGLAGPPWPHTQAVAGLLAQEPARWMTVTRGCLGMWLARAPVVLDVGTYDYQEVLGATFDRRLLAEMYPLLGFGGSFDRLTVAVLDTAAVDFKLPHVLRISDGETHVILACCDDEGGEDPLPRETES